MSISLSDGVLDGVELRQPAIDEVVPYEESDDKNKKAHVVNPPMNLHLWRPGMEGQDIVDVARTLGVEVMALCGYKFIPKHDPDKHDACEVCIKIAGDILSQE